MSVESTCNMLADYAKRARKMKMDKIIAELQGHQPTLAIVMRKAADAGFDSFTISSATQDECCKTIRQLAFSMQDAPHWMPESDIARILSDLWNVNVLVYNSAGYGSMKIVFSWQRSWWTYLFGK